MKQEITPEIIDNLKDKMCNGGEEIAKAILSVTKGYTFGETMLTLALALVFTEAVIGDLLEDEKTFDEVHSFFVIAYKVVAKAEIFADAVATLKEEKEG